MALDVPKLNGELSIFTGAGELSHGYGADKHKTIGNPALLYLASLSSKKSRQTMSRVLRQVAIMGNVDSIDDAPWHQLNREVVFAVLGRLEKRGNSYRTINLYLSALKGVAREAKLSGLISTDDYEGIKLVKSRKGKRKPRGRHIKIAEISSLLHETQSRTYTDKDGQPYTKKIDVRDAAIMAMLYGSGPRREELVELRVEDIRADLSAFTVIGKGDKERLVPIPPAFRSFVKKWIELYQPAPGAPLFCSINRWNQVKGKPLTGNAIADLVKKRQKELGLESMSPHDFRRSIITELLDQGEGINDVAEWVGHSSIETTKLYDLRGERAILQASERVKFDI